MDLCNIKSPEYKTWGNCTQLDLHSKHVYNATVKVTDWEKYSESLPIDVDPYCPSAFNLHYSHYNKLGGDTSPINYITTTQHMLSQIFSRRRELEVNPNKNLVNLYTDMNNIEDEKKQIICSSRFGADFVTTMQHSYQPPYPYLLKRLSMAEPPYFLYKFLKAKEPGKFLDDDHTQHTQRLQMYKSGRHISYNPGTGYYTDGTLGDTRDIY